MDAVNHTVTSVSNLFDSGPIPPNGTYTRTFTAAGTYSYYCSIHPDMMGTIKVDEGSGY
jgi:plastocyanin